MDRVHPLQQRGEQEGLHRAEAVQGREGEHSRRGELRGQQALRDQDSALRAGTPSRPADFLVPALQSGVNSEQLAVLFPSMTRNTDTVTQEETELLSTLSRESCQPTPATGSPQAWHRRLAEASPLLFWVGSHLLGIFGWLPKERRNVYRAATPETFAHGAA